MLKLKNKNLASSEHYKTPMEEQLKSLTRETEHKDPLSLWQKPRGCRAQGGKEARVHISCPSPQDRGNPDSGLGNRLTWQQQRKSQLWCMSEATCFKQISCEQELLNTGLDSWGIRPGVEPETRHFLHAPRCCWYFWSVHQISSSKLLNPMWKQRD